MRLIYVKDCSTGERTRRYKAVLHFSDGGVERFAHLATIRRGATGGAMRWIVSFNPRFKAADGWDSFDRATYREARAELEATFFVELVGYREGLDVLSIDREATR